MKIDNPFLQETAEFLASPALNVFPGINILATMCCLSVTGFKVKFREKFSMTSYEYFQTARMTRAHALLTEGKYVKETAYAIGFTNCSHFARAFKNQFGYSPQGLHRRLSAQQDPAA